MIKAEKDSVSTLCKKVRNGKYMRMEKEVKWNLVFCLLCSPYKKEGAAALPEPLEG